jgi:hypothetical protein
MHVPAYLSTYIIVVVIMYANKVARLDYMEMERGRSINPSTIDY